MISRHRQRFSSRAVKFASQVLYSMWVHQELREVYRKAGWKETDFVTKTIAARNARPNSPTNLNSTLNRPMASQSGTRYEDRTMQRGGQASGGGAIAAHMNNSAAGYMVSFFPFFLSIRVLFQMTIWVPFYSLKKCKCKTCHYTEAPEVGAAEINPSNRPCMRPIMAITW